VEDIDGAVSTYRLIQEVNGTDERVGRPIKAVMILAMTTHGTVIARHVRHELAAAGYPLLVAEMAHRVAYLEAGIAGLSPVTVEPDGAAARDIAAIVHEIMTLSSHNLIKTKNNKIIESKLPKVRRKGRAA
jgi:chromosome partitioning protein